MAVNCSFPPNVFNPWHTNTGAWEPAHLQFWLLQGRFVGCASLASAYINQRSDSAAWLSPAGRGKLSGGREQENTLRASPAPWTAPSPGVQGTLTPVVLVQPAEMAPERQPGTCGCSSVSSLLLFMDNREKHQQEGWQGLCWFLVGAALGSCSAELISRLAFCPETHFHGLICGAHPWLA